MPRNSEGRPRPGNGPANHTADSSIVTQGDDTARETHARRRWERHCRIPVDGWRIALATAAVDTIERVPSPFDISFAEARALAAVHGAYCDCHPAPAQQQSRGAA